LLLGLARASRAVGAVVGVPGDERVRRVARPPTRFPVLETRS